jgi:hypothetical protein
VASLVRRVARHHDLMAEPGWYLVVASRAAIGLQRLVGLDVRDLELVVRVVRHPNIAQYTNTATTTSAIATTSTSVPRFARARNGFNPIRSP